MKIAKVASRRIIRNIFNSIPSVGKFCPYCGVLIMGEFCKNPQCQIKQRQDEEIESQIRYFVEDIYQFLIEKHNYQFSDDFELVFTDRTRFTNAPQTGKICKIEFGVKVFKQHTALNTQSTDLQIAGVIIKEFFYHRISRRRTKMFSLLQKNLLEQYLEWKEGKGETINSCFQDSDNV